MKNKIIKNKTISIINILIIFIIVTSLFTCTPTSKITKLTPKQVNYFTKIEKFTVILTNKSGEQTINLETNRAGFFFSETELNIKGMEPLNFLYGRAIQKRLQSIAKSKGKTVNVEYINPEKLLLIYNDQEEEDDKNLEWLSNMGIDAIFYINQNKLSLDYMTRVPNLGGFNILYTLLILDLWYVDLFGEWYIKNDLSYTIKFPKTGKWIKVEDQSKSASLSKFNHINISIPILEDGIMETVYDIFLGELKNE
jgi:hypothetical protein